MKTIRSAGFLGVLLLATTVARPAEKVDPPPEPPDYKLTYSPTDPKATLVLARQTKPYHLWLPSSSKSLVEEEAWALEPIVRSAIGEVERMFGPFAQPIDVCLFASIRSDRSGGAVGLAWWSLDRSVLAVTTRDFRDLTQTLIHELVHIRLRERGDWAPAPWLNEGFSHYAETLGELSHDLLRNLAAFASAPTYEDLDRRGTDWSARAFGFVLVHYWVRHEGKSLDEALKLARRPRFDWPEPKTVLDYARALTAGK